MKISKESIHGANYRARSVVDGVLSRALKFLADADKKKRQEACLCLYCFYVRGPRISGQAFTEWDCEECGEKAMHSNTSVPHYCLDCAWKYNVCADCGADLELRPRLKVRIINKGKRPGSAKSARS